jgi:hypothetical protein
MCQYCSEAAVFTVTAASPHPKTIESIQSQGADSSVPLTAMVDQWRCGCCHGKNTGAWWLCQYHDGYDDGVEAATPPEVTT